MNQLAGRIRLDFRADEPITLQIVRQVEGLVASGDLKPGDQLPTVREMAIDLRINFSTVARAYRILDERRMISTQRGRGTYIGDEAAPPASTPAGEANIPSTQLAGLAQRFIREAAGQGATPTLIAQAFQQELENWQRDLNAADENHDQG